MADRWTSSTPLLPKHETKATAANTRINDLDEYDVQENVA